MRCTIYDIENKKTDRLDGERRYILDITRKEIDIYLEEIKNAIRKNNYRIERNSKRQENINLFLDYVIDEKNAKDILLELTSSDFSEVLKNEHKGYEHERLYVFGKDVELLERTGSELKTVSLYIKFNKIDSCYVIVVSLHEQKYPIKYYFNQQSDKEAS